MGKRKIAQKNTLSQWAGVQSGDDARHSAALTFKVDVDKLRARQCGHVTDLAEESRQEVDRISESSSCHTPIVQTSLDQVHEHTGQPFQPVISQHPFFERPIVQTVLKSSWTGIDSAKQASHPSILRFKVPADKLRASQGRLLRTYINDGTQASDKPSLPYNDSNQLPRAVIPQHPFFQKPKPQTSKTADTSIPLNLPITRHSCSSATETEPHAFFKPRTMTQEKNAAEEAIPTKRSTLLSPIMPSRHTMNVTGQFSSSFAEGRDMPFPGKRKRKISCLANEIIPDWTEIEWWTDTCRKCIARAQRAQPLRSYSPSCKENSTMPKFTIDHTALQRFTGDNAFARGTDLSSEPGVLWTSRYAPRCAKDVLQDGPVADLFRDWLISRRFHMRDRLGFTVKKNGLSMNRYADESDDFIVDDDPDAPLTSDIGASFSQEANPNPAPPSRELLWRSNLIVICGPTGSGKSAAIQAVAEELAFDIFEVNATDRRSAKDVHERVGEASQSQMVNRTKAADGRQSKSLLLFEEVDVLFKDDKEFWPAVLSLGMHSKRPVVLTCNDIDLLPEQLLLLPSLRLEFKAPSAALSLQYLHSILRLENVSAAHNDIEALVCRHKGDLRGMINALHFSSLVKSGPGVLDQQAIAHDLMSQQQNITTLYRPVVPDLTESQVRHKGLLHKYQQSCDDLGYVDMLATQQRSVALEAPSLYENEMEENTARPLERDDLIGPQILSEPLGRFTRLHPGDFDMSVDIAFALDNMIKSSQPLWPMWSLDSNLLGQASIHELVSKQEERMWTVIMEACDSFAVPENWMQDYGPQSCIARGRSSGVLATDVMPFLREIARTEDVKEEMEQAAMASHVGRTTRNTMSHEFGAAWLRPRKIPAEVRCELLATELHAPGDPLHSFALG